MFSLRLSDEEFVNRPGGRDAGSGLWVILIAVLTLFFGFGFWAANFEIEEVTRASGRVVPGSQVQSVQSPEGGVVATIEVREGDRVEPGQVLFQIDDTTVKSRLGELQQRHHALTARLTRLRAEADGATEVGYPANSELNSRIVEAETALFKSRRTQLNLELEVLRGRLAQKTAERVELQAKQNRLDAVMAPLRREVEISESLLGEGAVSEIEVLRLQSDLAEIEGDLLVLAATEQKLAAGAVEIETQIETVAASYGLAAQEEIAVVLSELSVVEESLTAARDRVSRTALRAPVRGTVNRVLVANSASVVQPGAVLAEIVPLEDTLLIEAQVNPRDVAFVRVGAPASVKITAYDYLRYGDLAATVERIGADALQNTEGAPYFEVMLRTQEISLEKGNENLRISPGMVASIDIQSGQKTVLEYLFQPVLRARHEALRER